MDITFNILHAFSPDSPLDENSDVLRILLDCQVQLNLAYLRTHAVPALYRSGVRYGRTILWENIPAAMARGYGDCKTLAPWLAAEYIAQGIPASCVFRFLPQRNGSGYLDFHILVHRHDTNTFPDPSRELGMGSNENASFNRGTRNIMVDR